MSRDDTNEEGSVKPEGRSGGEASAFEIPVPVTTSAYVKSSLTGGLIALAVFITYAILLNLPRHPVMPIKVFASLAVGKTALSKEALLSQTIPLGVLSALLFSLLWSAVFGLILGSSRSKWTPGSIVTSSMVYGSVVWLVNFYLLAPIFWPWMLPLSSVHLFVGLVFFFGLPLGGWVASRTLE